MCGAIKGGPSLEGVDVKNQAVIQGIVTLEAFLYACQRKRLCVAPTALDYPCGLERARIGRGSGVGL